MRTLIALGAAAASLVLVATPAATAQSGNHGYCYVYGPDMKAVYVSDPYPVPSGPDMSFQEFGNYLSQNQGVTKRPGCDSGYNGRAVATQARQNLITEARQRGIKVVEIHWPL
jgi:hypothetical protein